MMKKRTIYWILALLLGAVQPVDAQVGLHIDLSAPQAEIDGHHVALRFSVAAQGMKVKPLEQYVVELTLADSTRRWQLPEVVYAGGIRYRYRERAAFFADSTAAEPYRVYRRVKPDRAYVLDYRLSLPLEPWMEQADLLYTIHRGDRRRETVTSGTLIERLKPVVEEKPAVWNLDPEVYRKMLLFDAPAAEEVKRQTWKFTLPADGGVPDTVKSRLDSLFAHPWIAVEAIRLRGCGSPDGPEPTNDRTARERTEQMYERLTALYGAKMKDADMDIVGEDWAGLSRLVAARDTLGAEDAQSIILDPALSPEVKEKILRRIHRGYVWKWMVPELFPALRRIEVEVDYTVDPIRVERSRAYETAAVYDPTWRNAVAAARLSAGDTEGAVEILRTMEVSPQAEVNLGVYYYLAGDLTRAEQCFARAAEGGEEKGVENLRILQEYTIE